MVPALQIRPFRGHPRRRTGPAGDVPPPPPPPPVEVRVVAVTAVGGDGVHVDWLFDADVVSVEAPGLLLAGPDANPPDEWEQVGPRTLRCVYAAGIAPGDGWYLRPDFGQITFDPPGTLANQDGMVA